MPQSFFEKSIRNTMQISYQDKAAIIFFQIWKYPASLHYEPIFIALTIAFASTCFLIFHKTKNRDAAPDKTSTGSVLIHFGASDSVLAKISRFAPKVSNLRASAIHPDVSGKGKFLHWRLFYQFSHLCSTIKFCRESQTLLHPLLTFVIRM